MLAGLGVASAAAITALAPGSAKAGWGGGWGGWGGWGGCNDDDPEDVVWGLLGAFEMLDVEEIASWLHQDIVFQNSGLDDLVGKAAVEGFMGFLAPTIESCTIDVVSIMTKGEVVCHERIEHLVIAEDAPVGIPGAELTLRVSGWHEVHHGKIIRWSDYWDTRVFSETLGIPL